jgi:hypothetical protein
MTARGDVRAVRLIYGGYWMRSLAETYIAALLDVWQIPWRYEQKSYDTPAGPYLPDFSRHEEFGCRAPDWFPDFVEVKPDSDLQAAARALGLPDWDGQYSRRDRVWQPDHNDGRFDHYGISRHVASVCPTDPAWSPLAKPYWLAGRYRRLVWVVGRPGCNSLVIRFDQRGGVTVDRDCQLFRHRTNYDGWRHVLAGLRDTDADRRDRLSIL